jgi:hypothetical protein
VWNELSNSWQGTPASRRAASGPFLTRTKLGHPEGDLFNSFDRRLT